ncbi:MAG: hypothetical protein ABSE40_22940 [Candidatus Sulfotelmatobacter sp.]|jgi:hypothetical protein
MTARSLVLAIAIVAVLAAWPVSMAAQMDPYLKVDVPFSFRAGNTLMPAGSYRITRKTQYGNTLQIEHETQAIVLSVERWQLEDSSVPKVVFQRYGDTYFLSQVWMTDRWSGLPMTKLQREFAARSSGEPTVQFAKK